MSRVAVVFLVLSGLVAIPLAGQSRKKARGHGEPGVFDYYVLSLSWSPQYCSGPSGSGNSEQCSAGREYGFVAHGLWPQYEKGYPESCEPTDPVRSGIVRSMLRLMPSEALIQHEWEAHGTCSGLDQPAYFQAIQKAYAVIKIPFDYAQPIKQIEVSPDDVVKTFAQANPAFPDGSIHVLCGGRFLSEIRICLTKDLKPRACSASVRDTCKADPIIMRPVR